MIADNVLPNISWLMGPKMGQHGKKNQNYYFSLKLQFNHRFPIFPKNFLFFSGFNHS